MCVPPAGPPSPAPARSAATIAPPVARGARGSAVTDSGQRAQLGAVVTRRHAPDGARPRAHRERLGRRAPIALVAHALEHIAVGDAGGGEEHVLAADQVVAAQDPREVVALRLGGGPLLVVARPQPALHLAPDALDRGRGDDALGR